LVALALFVILFYRVEVLYNYKKKKKIESINLLVGNQTRGGNRPVGKA
jgi:hypothetical protein